MPGPFADLIGERRQFVGDDRPRGVLSAHDAAHGEAAHATIYEIGMDMLSGVATRVASKKTIILDIISGGTAGVASEETLGNTGNAAVHKRRPSSDVVSDETARDVFIESPFFESHLSCCRCCVGDRRVFLGDDAVVDGRPVVDG